MIEKYKKIIDPIHLNKLSYIFDINKDNDPDLNDEFNDEFNYQISDVWLIITLSDYNDDLLNKLIESIIIISTIPPIDKRLLGMADIKPPSNVNNRMSLIVSLLISEIKNKRIKYNDDEIMIPIECLHIQNKNYQIQHNSKVEIMMMYYIDKIINMRLEYDIEKHSNLNKIEPEVELILKPFTSSMYYLYINNSKMNIPKTICCNRTAFLFFEFLYDGVYDQSYISKIEIEYIDQYSKDIHVLEFHHDFGEIMEFNAYNKIFYGICLYKDYSQKSYLNDFINIDFRHDNIDIYNDRNMLSELELTVSVLPLMLGYYSVTIDIQNINLTMDTYPISAQLTVLNS